MEEKYCVYKHTAPNGKVYIGITKRNPIKRWEGGNGYKYNRHFYSAILKYGWDNFSHEILLTDLTKEEAEIEEIRLISEYRSADPACGYNLRLGGSLAGFNERTIEKMRASHLGYKMPEEQRRKIGEAAKGRKPTRGMLGHFHSDETKLKMSIAAKGKPKPHMAGKGNPRARAVVNCDTGECFDTIQSASVKYGCNRVGITRCCEMRQETCGGYRWAYTGDD